jgi:hypothetical protein
MSTWIKVARYQLTDRYIFVVSPWLILALDFLINLTHAWHGVGHFFTTLTIEGLTGLLAAAAVALLAGGYGTVRRLAV